MSGGRIENQEMIDSPYNKTLYSTTSINILDFVVSLHKTPSSQAERDRYRKVLEYFADAVYEATEGKIRVGNIYIYTDYRFASKADILWRNSGWPNSFISAYDKLEGQHINMFDVFGETFDITKDDDKEYRKAGYTIAHELGHYAFGLYDEYKVPNNAYWDECKAKRGEDLCQGRPRMNDDPVAPSIMNKQYCAINLEDPYCLMHPFSSKTPKWLNFSIKANSDYGDGFETKENTAQYRVHKKSAWETLTSDPKDDASKYLWSNNAPLRTQFLSLIAPKDEPTIQLPNSNARSKFKIFWMTDKLVYQIVLDKSPSMDYLDNDGTARIVKAKAAAKQLVEAAEIGKTAIGIIAFCSYASVVYPVTDIFDSNTSNYAAILSEYHLNGTYTINIKANNNSNTAYLTNNQGMMSIDLNGNLPSSSPDIHIGENIERMTKFQITIQGVVDDDHGNNFETATTINADNRDYPGKIDIAGDLDFFKIILPGPSGSDIIFRITALSPEMKPVLKVYDSNQKLLREKTYISGSNYIAIIEKTNSNSVFYASVGYSGGNGTGTYYISAGPKIATDNDYRLYLPLLYQ